LALNQPEGEISSKYAGVVHVSSRRTLQTTQAAVAPLPGSKLVAQLKNSQKQIARTLLSGPRHR